MNVILYIYIFLIGITFGSFFTLAIHRIPRNQDITHTRSYCPKCNHKLSFWDMIPMLSYIFLRGKCRYCKTKIAPKYFFIELLTGLTFVLFAYSLRLQIFNLYFICGLLYIAGLFVISGIDKEHHEVRLSVILYMTIVQAIYIIYLYIIEQSNVYRYVIYLVILAILILSDTIYFRKKLKNNYILENLILLNVMLMFTYEACTILTVEFALIVIAIKSFIEAIKNRKTKPVKKKQEKIIPIAFYLCVTNIITLIITNILCFYR